jgi:hypothetical protein
MVSVLLFYKCQREIEAIMAFAKAGFSRREKTLFTSKLNLNLRNKSVK